MILQGDLENIEIEQNYQQQKPSSQNKIQQIKPQMTAQDPQPVIMDMMFIPPPINDSSKYHDQLQTDFLQNLTKNPNALDYITLFGQKRPLDIQQKKLPQPLFVDSAVKTKMKKLVRGIYEKMIESFKYCAGQMPINYSSPLPKIQQKSHQFMLLCQQLQVAQTKAVIWKMMQQQTKQMNQKAKQIEDFIDGMVKHCKNQQKKNFHA